MCTSCTYMVRCPFLVFLKKKSIIAPAGRPIDSGARVGVGARVAHCDFSVPLPSDQSKLSVRPCKIQQKSGSAPMVEIT